MTLPLSRTPSAGEMPGLLGDTAARDYSRKLRSFNAFAEPELRQVIASLGIEPGMRILDAGCGSGEALQWLSAQAGDRGEIVGVDLSAAHTAAARERAPKHARVLQADLTSLPREVSDFDLIWCANALNHLHDPVRAIETLAALLRRGGRIAIGQSCLLPDMIFAWDSRLERLVNEAVRAYYRDRYGLSEHDLKGVRSLVGWLRAAHMSRVAVRTTVIERTAPLSSVDEAYLLETVFRGTWGERLQPYLCATDYSELQRLCDPTSGAFVLRRADFHFMQTFTLAIGEI
jgi:SAM-dependent methyltransferase